MLTAPSHFIELQQQEPRARNRQVYLLDKNLVNDSQREKESYKKVETNNTHNSFKGSINDETVKSLHFSLSGCASM
jgi:hypothetical protein